MKPQNWPTTGTDLDPARASFPARLVVDPGAIAANFKLLAGLAQPAQLMPILKANAYGHGLGLAADAVVSAGAGWIGVAQAEEAVRLAAHLRQSGARARVFTWIYGPGQARAAVAAGLDLSVSTPAQVAECVEAADTRPVRLHLKVDTGMSRAGARPEALADLVAAVCRAQHEGRAEVVGLWSHFARADSQQLDDRAATARQLAEFEVAEHQLQRAGLTVSVRHLAASAGLLWHGPSRKDLVRPGIALYGLSPNPDYDADRQPALVPAMRFEALLTMVKRVPAGAEVSYGGAWVAPTPRWLGIVPVGYANGVPRQASNRAEVEIGGRRYRQVGRICMDQFMVDLGPAADHEGTPIQPPAAVGDLVTLFGSAPAPDAWEWAHWAGTISYQILCQAGANVPRRVAGPQA